MEIFKQIQDYPNYEISSYGNIRNISTKRFLKKYISSCGYLTLELRNSTHIKKLSVHRLLALTFIPNPENKKCVNHINGIKLDNSLGNLEWATYLENNIHALKTGLRTFETKKCFKEKIKTLFNSKDWKSALEFFKEIENL